MKKRIVIINGVGGSGKDTFVELCAKHANVINISSVDKVKEAAKVLVGWNGEKDEKSRKLLVDLKKISIEYNDYPTAYILEEHKKFLKSDATILFIHIIYYCISILMLPTIHMIYHYNQYKISLYC